jgi:N-acetylmuramoyl-L-alanine amidase
MITKKVILLDAGHGGLNEHEVYVTPGKRSPVWSDGSQYFEGVGNRMIRNEIAKLLKEDNFPYHYINVGYADLELFQRVNIANEFCKAYGADNCLLVSIHSNAFQNSNAEGWEVFTSPGQTKSDKLAEILFESMKQQFPDRKYRADYADGDSDKEANFAMLVGPMCASVLSENFFHTNEHECRSILMTHEGRKKIARAHHTMIKYFINEK